MHFKWDESQDQTMKKLSDTKTQRLLLQLREPWEVVDDKYLRAEFSFGSFDEAMLFVNDIAAIAEDENHHPDIEIHFDKVVIELSTHEVDGLTKTDFLLAHKIEICC